MSTVTIVVWRGLRLKAACSRSIMAEAIDDFDLSHVDCPPVGFFCTTAHRKPAARARVLRRRGRLERPPPCSMPRGIEIVRSRDVMTSYLRRDGEPRNSPRAQRGTTAGNCSKGRGATFAHLRQSSGRNRRFDATSGSPVDDERPFAIAGERPSCRVIARTLAKADPTGALLNVLQRVCRNLNRAAGLGGIPTRRIANRPPLKVLGFADLRR